MATSLIRKSNNNIITILSKHSKSGYPQQIHLHLVVLGDLCWQRFGGGICRGCGHALVLGLARRSWCYVEASCLSFQRTRNLWHQSILDVSNTTCFVILLLLIDFTALCRHILAGHYVRRLHYHRSSIFLIVLMHST